MQSPNLAQLSEEETTIDQRACPGYEEETPAATATATATTTAQRKNEKKKKKKNSLEILTSRYTNTISTQLVCLIFAETLLGEKSGIPPARCIDTEQVVPTSTTNWC
ncbi:hypothetical protein M0802_008202 [Mischocyttarus mexicanus]|nr:hypothetical protein M0802_008202 [Mischocyttarus mexicanus]